MSGERAIITITCLVCWSGGVGAWPWQSCEEKWDSAWASCEEEAKEDSIWDIGRTRCDPLPERFHPSCEPDDPYLRKYRGGRKEYERIERLRDERRRRNAANISKISVLNYQYSVQSGRLFLFADVHNGHPGGTLHELSLDCRVIANNAIELHDGTMVAQPSLISGSTAQVPLYFSYLDYSNTNLYSNRAEQRLSESVSTQGYSIQSLSADCHVNEIYVGDLLGPGGYFTRD